MKKFLTGVTYYNPTKAFQGYTLWCGITEPVKQATLSPYEITGKIHLMNMDGSSVHTWKTPYPSFTAYLMENGNLLTTQFVPDNEDGQRPGVGQYLMGGTQGYLMELDWEGNILFEHKDLAMHHDFKKLSNGNYIYLAWEKLPTEVMKKVRGGMKGTEHNGNTMFSDVIKEITPQGNIVWEWHAKDHLDFDIDIIGPMHHRNEWSHINTLWVCEDGDIMLSSRYLDMAFKISRKTGDIIWRFGNAAYLDKETNTLELKCNINTLGGQHDVHIIPTGLPGAGNMLCYDNGMYKYISRAVEVDMNTKEVVWQSTDKMFLDGRNGFSCFISGCRRLPNGNTFLCDGQDGRFYEVTKDQEMVWEYNRPDHVDHTRWAVFRAYRYAPDFCPQFKTLPAPTMEAIDR